MSESTTIKNDETVRFLAITPERFEEMKSLIAELEQQLAQEREANRWIPVTESIPKEQGVYLVSFHNGVFGWFDCCELYFTPNLVFNNLIEHGATHWRKIQEVK